MKIGITGKGGAGKTTIAGTLARIFAQRRQRVLALDVDSNPNLAVSLGISRAQMAQTAAIPYGLTEWRNDADGKAYVHLNQPVSQFITDYGVAGPDGIRLLVMGEVVQASIGCRCEAHAVARGITGHLVSEADIAVLDMEAGLEHLGRGTLEHVNAMLVVMEPYYRSLETAAHARDLGAQLGVPHIFAVANKARTEDDQRAIAEFCSRHDLELLASIPYDEAVPQAERQATSLLELAPHSPAAEAMRVLADQLEQRVV